MKKMLEKIRAWPEAKREKIFWSLIVVASLVSLFLYVKIVQKKLRRIHIEKAVENVRLPKVEMPSLPKLENPPELKTKPIK